MTGQSKRLSLIEAIANVLVGYGVAVLAQLAIFPAFGIAVSIGDNLAIGAVIIGIVAGGV